MENKKQAKKELIRYIELNVDLKFRFQNLSTLKEYKFKHYTFNIVTMIRDILIQHRYELLPIAEKYDLKDDLYNIYMAKHKCRKYLRKYGWDSKINILYDQLESLELKMIWVFLPEYVRKKYFCRFILETIHISLPNLNKLLNELFN